MGDTDDEQVIDITIESLTGTLYDLCVSPFETILGIKLKIQRLEGIPVYQQHLVHGSTELQDELCLEEHRIRSGAQLKLLIAMRGGPIHAHRVHLDLEDSTFLEIAELLESEGGSDHKYTVMLLRDGDALDMTDFVQMYSEDSCESVSCSPVQVSDSHQQVNVTSSSKATQREHALTKDKMKEVMGKLRKLRGFKGYQSVAGPHSSGSQFQRKGTAKVLILDSRASSRLLSSRQSPLPTQCSGHRLSAQRRLMFTPEDCTCCQSKHHRSKRGRSPDRETPQLCRRRGEEGCKRQLPPCHHPQRERDWRKAAKRVRRSSGVGDTEPQSTKETDLINQVTQQVSQLGLDSRERPWVPREAARERHHRRERERGREKDERRNECSLPKISTSSEHKYSPLTFNTSSSSRRTSGHSSEHLPPLVAAAATTPVKQPLPRRRSRCLQCGKKMGLATTYYCRCGGVFCALHRYAETHSCSFDYKTEGRQIIARTNPVITAPKLPKI